MTLTHDDLSVIVRALHDAPYRFAAPLIGKLNQQIEQQTGQQNASDPGTEAANSESPEQG